MNEADLRREYERLKALYEVSNLLHSALEPRQVFDVIVRECVRLLNASSGSVILLNPTTGLLEIEASAGLSLEAAQLRLKPGEGVTGWVAQTGKPARIGKVSSDERYIPVRESVMSEMAVPLLVNEEVRGVLNVDSDRENAFSSEDEELLSQLAQHASVGIERTWAHERARVKAALLESLLKVGQTINSTVSIHEALDVITEEAARLMSGRIGTLLLLDETRELLELKASFGLDGEGRKNSIHVSDSLLGAVVRRKKALQLENLQGSARYSELEVSRMHPVSSLLSVPLLFRAGVLGTLNIYTENYHVFSNEEITTLSAFAELSAVAIEKAKLYEKVVAAEEQLRQNEKLSALGLLAAEVAHEIRNPLTVVKMLFHSLNLQFNDDRAQDAALIGAKIEDMNRILEKVLDFARHAEPKQEAVELEIVINNVLLLVRHKLATSKIQLKREITPNVPAIWGDRLQLEQAVINIVINAIEAMPEGGSLQVNLSADRLGARLAFTDTGGGFPVDAERRSILESTKDKGTGLGLAIIRRIAEAHEGMLEILSEPGKGSTVALLFPARLFISQKK